MSGLGKGGEAGGKDSRHVQVAVARGRRADANGLVCETYMHCVRRALGMHRDRLNTSPCGARSDLFLHSRAACNTWRSEEGGRTWRSASGSPTPALWSHRREHESAMPLHRDDERRCTLHLHGSPGRARTHDQQRPDPQAAGGLPRATRSQSANPRRFRAPLSPWAIRAPVIPVLQTVRRALYRFLEDHFPP